MRQGAAAALLALLAPPACQGAEVCDDPPPPPPRCPAEGGTPTDAAVCAACSGGDCAAAAPPAALIPVGALGTARALLGEDWDRFWTEHHERKAVLLHSDLAALGIPQRSEVEWLLLLGRLIDATHSSMELAWGPMKPGLQLGTDVQIGSSLGEEGERRVADAGHHGQGLRGQFFMPALLSSGGTAIFHDFDGRDLAAHRLSQAVNHLFGYEGGVSLYVTGANGTQGVPPHQDVMDVIAIQVVGQKRWRVWRDAAPLLPLQDMAASPDEIAAAGGLQADPQEFTLRAGDALYVPRGAVHQADNGGSEAVSVHLSVGVESEPRSWAALLQYALAEAPAAADLDAPRALHVAAHAAAERDAELRHSAALSAQMHPGGAVRLAAAVAEAVAAFLAALGAAGAARAALRAAEPQLLRRTTQWWADPTALTPMETGPAVLGELRRLGAEDGDWEALRAAAVVALAPLSGGGEAAGTLLRRWDAVLCAAEARRRDGWAAWLQRNAAAFGHPDAAEEAASAPLPHCQYT
eukprot:TRINITY_DN8349_c0_g2_i1.p1 TRINITY_DN8349_c0_g2~~TRINITY_DN8349_c0_g2_i1.p1  ORF type:complete len:545 (+),score=168.33 TRINITY_DN8349_c0_g2_i1:71-1636(+)